MRVMIRRILLPACLVLLLGIPRGSLVAANCTVAAPCKILALHGGGGSANSMQANMAGLAESLGAAYTFVYASIGGPNVAEIWWEDPPGGKGQATTDPAHASAMVTALNTIRADQGPFWGLIGYSQGAAAVPVYLSNVPDGTFQAAAMFCGYLTTTHTGLLNKVNDEAPFGDIPALIWFSTTDSVITPGLSRRLGPKFTSPNLMEADPGPGHIPPSCGGSTFNDVVTWFQTTGGASAASGGSAACSRSAAAGTTGLAAAALMVVLPSIALSLA